MNQQQRVRNVQASFLLSGKELPVLSFRVSLGSYGSLSTFHATSSIAMLRYLGIDVVALSEDKDGATVDINAGYDGNSEHIFAGVLDEAEWDFDQDRVELHGRDFGANLIDTKDTVARINFKNQTIGQIVTQIAKKFDLTPKVTDPGTKAGSEMWGESCYLPHAQQWWSVLQDLARQANYEVLITPDKELYFGPPDKAAGKDITVTYGAAPESSAKNPLLGLRIVHQPRRNGNFEVRVISYHPQKAQLVKASSNASIISTNSSSSRKKIVVGKSGRGRNVRSSGSKTSASAKPILTYHIDGLTQEQADAKAKAIADDLAKRQIILDGEIEGLPEMKVHSKLKLQEEQIDLMGFSGRDYTISAVEHDYSVPESGSGGFRTTFKAMSPSTSAGGP